MKVSASLIIITLLCFVAKMSWSQPLPQYNMANMTVTDCEAIFLDSDAGTAMSYDNDEDFTFTITTGATITLTFSSFNTEVGNDSIRFFDGPNVSSPQIGSTYSGNITIPTIIATSGSLTINFKSDNSVIRPGWTAQWKSEHIPPVEPKMTVDPIPACNANTITVTYDKKIACNPIAPSDFTITGGILGLFVTTVTSPACIGAGDSTTTLNLGLSQPLDVNCDYEIDMDIGIADNCDSIWDFILRDTFQLNTCPFTVQIVATEDTVCPGVCTELEAIITGNPGNCLAFNYTWSNGLPNSPGPHVVCPTSTTNYTLSVQQVEGGHIATDSRVITYVDPSILTADSMMMCQSDTAFIITKTPVGGTFSGNGIVDPVSGLFDPGLAGGGNHVIRYNMSTECYDSIVVIVTPIEVGNDEAACPGVAPFMVSGFSPPGGTWSGDSISPAGLFNPATSGAYIITYSINGCTASKYVFVDSIDLKTPIDTLCESDTAIHIEIEPLGGIWSGPGIVDSIGGIFDPNVAGPGNKLLIYSLNGCNFQINVFINEIEAGGNRTYCPFQSPLTLSPAGRPANGSWSGFGIVNAASGLYDPNMAFGGSNGNDTLTYTAVNGCADTKIIYLRNTSIGYDSVFFCATDTALLLDWVGIRRTPCCGVWTGQGVSRVNGNYYFNPSSVGVGIYTLTYARNTCSDTVKMVVHPTSINFKDTLVCSTHPPFALDTTFPSGGRWTGGGVDPITGVFDPSSAPIGTNFIRYQSPTSCVDDTVAITVYPFVPALISNIDSIQCFKDSAISITLAPQNGILSGSGLDSLGNFNPALAGEGVHTLHYTFGSGPCKTSYEYTITVLPELVTDVTVSDDEICLGQSAIISVSASGGVPNVKYTYNWSDGLFPQPTNTVIPTITTSYIITTSDGCSDPSIDTVLIRLAEDFKVSFNTNDKLCIGEEGFIAVKIDGSSTYDYQWDGPQRKKGDSILGRAGDIYSIIVTDLATNCTKDTIVKIPSFKNIQSNFLVNPNFDCIPSDRKNVIFIDISNNAVSGTWSFGTGDSIDYTPGINPEHRYSVAGLYTVSLRVQNSGGCEDTYTREICVQDIRPIFVADAFSPNGDGTNDVLHVKAKGIKEMSFLIYNRLGQKVFETNSMEEGWDGNFKGKQASTGVYIYIVTAKLINNETVTQKGNVSLVR